MSEQKASSIFDGFFQVAKAHPSFSCVFSPPNPFHEIGCPHKEWSKEELREALIVSKAAHEAYVNANLPSPRPSVREGLREEVEREIQALLAYTTNLDVAKGLQQALTIVRVVMDRKTYDGIVPRWIPVEERLPEKMGYYICRMDAEPDLGTRTDIVFYAIREHGSMAVIKTGWVIPVLYEWANNTVTHWMPLPSPPEGEG